MVKGNAKCRGINSQMNILITIKIFHHFSALCELPTVTEVKKNTRPATSRNQQLQCLCIGISSHLADIQDSLFQDGPTCLCKLDLESALASTRPVCDNSNANAKHRRQTKTWEIA